jgi:hypothetical protein
MAKNDSNLPLLYRGVDETIEVVAVRNHYRDMNYLGLFFLIAASIVFMIPMIFPNTVRNGYEIWVYIAWSSAITILSLLILVITNIIYLLNRPKISN